MTEEKKELSFDGYNGHQVHFSSLYLTILFLRGYYFNKLAQVQYGWQG